MKDWRNCFFAAGKLAWRWCPWGLMGVLLVLGGNSRRFARGEDVPKVSGVIQMLEASHAQWKDARFEYRVTSNMEDASVRGTVQQDDLTPRDTSETLSFHPPTGGKDPLGRVSWVVRSKSPGQTPISSFFVFDGKNSRRFLRGDSKDAGRSENIGIVAAGYHNTYLLDNYFERILFMKLNGSSRNLEAINPSKSASEYQFVKEVEVLGRQGWLFERVWVPGQLKTTTVVLDEPVAMVVSHQVLSLPDNRVLAEFQVEELSRFEESFYPSKGKYSETESGRSYQFEVTSVSKSKEDSGADWTPDWPKNTRVSHQATQKATRVESQP